MVGGTRQAKRRQHTSSLGRAPLVGFVAFLAALVSLIGAAPLGAQPLEPDVNRPGQDYRSFDLSSPNPELCKSACEAEAACKAWTFVRPGIQGPGARCWLKQAVPAPVRSDCCTSGVVAAGAGSSDPKRRAEQVFERPTIRGIRIDRCYNYSTDCDEPAATAFCRKEGYAAAVRWAWEYTSPTVTLGDGLVCDAAGRCGGFTVIVCRP